MQDRPIHICKRDLKVTCTCTRSDQRQSTARTPIYTPSARSMAFSLIYWSLLHIYKSLLAHIQISLTHIHWSLLHIHWSLFRTYTSLLHIYQSLLTHIPISFTMHNLSSHRHHNYIHITLYYFFS